MFVGGGGRRGPGYFPVGSSALASCRERAVPSLTAAGRAEVKAAFWSQMSLAAFPE